MAIYNLTGKAGIWWQDLKRVKGIREKNIIWSMFKKYFKKNFLSEQYYEEQAKKFYELKLGTMNMKELNSKFLSLLKYVPYIVDEKPKVQRFLSCLPYHINDIIEYDNPKTLEEAMRKVNFCYEQNRKKETMNNWKAKRNNNFEQKKKEFVPNRNSKNYYTKNFSSKNFQGNKSNSQINLNNQRNKESVNNHKTIQRTLNKRNP